MRIALELLEQGSEQRSPRRAAVIRPQYATQRFTSEPGAAAFVRNRETPAADPMVPPTELGPANRTGADDDDAAVLAAVRADAGGARVAGDDSAAERIGFCLRRAERGWLSRSRQRQAGTDARQIRGGKTGLRNTLPGGIKDGGDTHLQPEANIGRTGQALAQPGT